MQAASSLRDLEQAKSPAGDVAMESAVSSPEGMGYSMFDQDVEMMAASPRAQSVSMEQGESGPGRGKQQPAARQDSFDEVIRSIQRADPNPPQPAVSQENSQAMNLQELNLHGSNIQRSHPQGSNHQGSSLPGSNLQGSHLQETSIQGSNPQGSNLQGTNLHGSTLQGSNVQDPNLQGCNVQESNQEITIQGGITFNTAGMDSNQQQIQNLLGQLLGNPLPQQTGQQQGTHLVQAPDGTWQLISTSGSILQNLPPQGTNNITLTSDTNTAPITTPFILQQPQPPGNPAQQVLLNPNTILLNPGTALSPQTIILNPVGVPNQPNTAQAGNTTIFVTPSNIGNTNLGNTTFLTSINGTPIQTGSIDPSTAGGNTTVLLAPNVGDPNTILLQHAQQQQLESKPFVPAVSSPIPSTSAMAVANKPFNSGSRRSLGKTSSQKTVQELLKEEDQKRVQVETKSLDMEKTRDALALRLKLRRPRNELVNQGIIPSTAFKSSPAFHEQLQRLERAKVGDHLQKKMRMRPDKAQLVHQHILEDTNLDPMVNARQQMLKRARIEQDLDIKIKNRPGPLELIEDNILKPESEVEQLVKDGALKFIKTAVAGQNSPFTFFDTGSDDALSPPQPDTSTSDTQPSSVTSIPSPSDSLFFSSDKVRTLSGSSLSSPHKATVSSTLPGMAIKQEQGVVSPPMSAGHSPFSVLSGPASSSSKNNSSSNSNRNHRKKQTKRAKPKEIKFHEYKPPNEQGSKAGNQPALGNPYNLLLMQQQLYLQLQLLQQQQQIVPEQPTTYTTPASNAPTTGSSMVLSPGAPQPPPTPQSVSVSASPSPSEAKITTTASSQSNTATTSASSTTVVKPFSLAGIEEMKVSELKAELKSRGLHVSGTKPQLVQRLRAAELAAQVGPAADSPDVTSSSTTKVTSSTDIDSFSNRRSLTSPPVSSPEMMRNHEPLSPTSPQYEPPTFQPIKNPPMSSPVSIPHPISFHQPSSLDKTKAEEAIMMSPPPSNSFSLKSPPPSNASTIGESSSCATTDVDMPAEFGRIPEVNSSELLKKQQQRIEELQRALELSQLQLMQQQQQQYGGNRMYTNPPPPPPPPPPPMHTSPPTNNDLQQFFPDLKLSSPPTTAKQANFQGQDFAHTINQHPKVFNFASPPSNGQPFQFTKTHPDLRAVHPANGIITPKSSSMPSSPTEEAILELGSGLARSITTPNFMTSMAPPPNYEEAVRQNNERKHAQMVVGSPPLLHPSSSAPNLMKSPVTSSNLSFDDLLEVLVGHGYPAVSTGTGKEGEVNPATTTLSSVMRSSPPPSFSTATSTPSMQRTLQDIVPSPGPMEVDSHDLSMYNHVSSASVMPTSTAKNRYSIPSMQIDSTDPENGLLSLTLESGSPAENAFPGALSADNDLNWLDLVLPTSTAGSSGNHSVAGLSMGDDPSSALQNFNKDPFALSLADLTDMNTATDFNHLDMDVWDNIQVTE